MAERWLVASGDTENPANWNGGTLPSSSDDLYANGFTGTITVSRNAASWRTTAGATAVAGGGFACSTAGVVIGGNIIAGTTTCLSISNGSGIVTVNGNATGSATTSTRHGIAKSLAGAFAFNGIATGGAAASSLGVQVAAGDFTGVGSAVGGSASGTSGIIITSTATGSHSFTGNCTGSNTGSNSKGISYQAATGSLVVTGDCTGGSAASTCDGLQVTGAGSTCTVNGNAIGCGGAQSSPGVSNDSTGTVVINGNAIGGTSTTGLAFGAENVSTGSLTVTGYAIGAPSGGTSPGLFGTSLSGTTVVGSVRTSVTGVAGIGGKVTLANLTTGTLQAASSALVLKTFYPTDFAGLLPAAGDVQDGVIYNLTNSTGTFEVPSESQVEAGVGYGENGTEFEGSLAATRNVPVVEFGSKYNVVQFEGCVESENLICKHARSSEPFYFDLSNLIPDGVTIVSATADTEDEDLTVDSVEILEEDTTVGPSELCPGAFLSGDRALLVYLSGGSPSDEEVIVTVNWVQSDGVEVSRDGRFLITGVAAA